MRHYVCLKLFGRVARSPMSAAEALDLQQLIEYQFGIPCWIET